ncbi:MULTISPECIES: hypothetical protein [unclassified Butyrivibrio]|nr:MULTISPECIES: hypothetical protein [unclassified Butyrivibrio]
MYTTVMTTVIGVICTLLVIASLIWMAIAYRKSGEKEDKTEEIKEGRKHE